MSIHLKKSVQTIAGAIVAICLFLMPSGAFSGEPEPVIPGGELIVSLYASPPI